ncbi:MAG: T9SS type A sorting domain-containing protein [Bacteroidales bacterium]|nr:T9SS type A sorting domain-containing protein [Bacteroidales bacterium]
MKTLLRYLKRVICTLLILQVSFIYRLCAQDYLISFAGSGESSTVDSVIVENLTRNTILKMKGNDVLHLSGAITGIEKFGYPENDKISFYPNPMKNNTMMQFILPAPGETNITLYDISGREIAHTRHVLPVGEQTYTLTGAGQGIYFARISSGKYSLSGKLISTGSHNKVVKIEYVSTMAERKKQSDGKGMMEEKIMEYTSGERLKLTGISDNYSTVIITTPASDTTINFNFVACTDADGNHYPVVHIGSAKKNTTGPIIGFQVWMAKNMAYLPKVSPPDAGTTVSPHYYVYGYDGQDVTEAKATQNYKTYGVLYNWTAALNVCPAGWHLPSDTEWTDLTEYLILSGHNWDGSIEYLEGIGYVDKTANSLSTLHFNWKYSLKIGTPGNDNDGSKNTTGFSALPGGYRNNTAFGGIRECAIFWSSTKKDNLSSLVWIRSISYNKEDLDRGEYYGPWGFSVRCIKD